MAWPTLPIEVIQTLNNFPEVEILGRRLLQINLDYKNKLKLYKKLSRDLILSLTESESSH